MDFVDIHGRPIDLGRLKTPKRAKAKKTAEASHKGFRVMGFSPAQVQQAREEHAKLQEQRRAQGGTPLPPFDIDGWTRNAKPTKVNPKPCATHSGAEEYQSLALQQGWVRVTIESMSKA